MDHKCIFTPLAYVLFSSFCHLKFYQTCFTSMFTVNGKVIVVPNSLLCVWIKYIINSLSLRMLFVVWNLLTSFFV